MLVQSKRSGLSIVLSFLLLLEALYVLFALSLGVPQVIQAYFEQGVIPNFYSCPSAFALMQVEGLFEGHGWYGWFWLIGLMLATGALMRRTYRRAKPGVGVVILAVTTGLLAFLAVSINVAAFQPLKTAPHPASYRILPGIFVRQPVR